MFFYILYLIILFLSIECESWYSETNFCDPNELNKGYAGSPHVFMTDFYLCGEIKYRVHYINSDWSKNFCCCQPVGNGDIIDKFEFNESDKYFLIRHHYNSTYHSKWNTKEREKEEEDIFFNPIDGIAIEGGDKYRFGYNGDNKILNRSSFEGKVAERFINILFKYINETISYNYDKEIEIINDKNNTKIAILFLEPSKINYNGDLIFKINYEKIEYAYRGGLIEENLKNILKEKINFDYNAIKKIIESSINESIINGNIAINYYWNENKIEIDFASKINTDFHSYRGGFRLIIYLKDNSAYFKEIKYACKIFLKYYGKLDGMAIKNIISNIKSFSDIEKVVKELGNYSVLLEEILLLLILKPLLNTAEIN